MKKPKYLGIYNKFFKRVIDFVLALILAIVLLPFYFIIGLVVAITSGFPVFYRPERGGYKDKTFRICKFRTMVKNADKIGGGTTALNDPRITKFGSFLRKTKLDETPQLFNILSGKMSFIGPRPELLRYTSRYSEEEKVILQVRPGITDYSSVEFINLDEIVGGTNADEMYEKHVLKRKNELRIKYANTVSFGTDFKLFFKTVFYVLKKAFRYIFGKKGKKKNSNMEYIKLKNSDLIVSRFCMGGCPMGGYGWGDTQEQDFIDAIHCALENGVNFFDTADTYGLGQSEITLAKGLGDKRKDVIIKSKFGVRKIDGKTVYDNSPEYIEKALEATLERLNTNYIDIYTIHYRDDKTPLKTVVEKLVELRDKGKIRYFGLSNIKEKDLEELKEFKGLFVNCQDEFSLAFRKNEADLKNVEIAVDVTPMTWGSLGQGILTGKYDKNTVFDSNDRRSREIYVNFHGKKLEQNLEIVEYLKEVSKRHNKSIAACAIRFILDYYPEFVVLAGVKRPDQLLSNIEAMGWHLDKDELEKLNNMSLSGDNINE